MSRNDARDFAERLYARIPSNYRVYDAELGQPLFALLVVVGEQVANVRQDLDTLWDNYFIETCDDWVVPYIGALIGTNLLQQPVGQSNRLDVFNTVVWRRSKGTPQMLDALATAISGWPADLAEFFQTLGWSQNMNHVRVDRPLTPDLRDPATLRLLGSAADPFGHAADFKTAGPMDEPRVTPQSLSVGVSSFGTPGRYQIRNAGFFVRRLHAFAAKGATPAAVAPGGSPPAGSSFFTFNPLFRYTPLFELDSGDPITRAAFAANPWEFFGSDSSIAVRQFGVLLAADAAPQNAPSSNNQTPFTFGGATSVALAPTIGMRLLQPRAFQLGSAFFLITAEWRHANNSTTNLGTLNTLSAALNKPSFTAAATATGAGQLAISVQTDGGSPAARFPGAVLAVRATRAGALHTTDAVYAYLPPAFLQPGKPAQYFVAADGSTWADPALSAQAAKSSEGQVWPARIPTASPDAASAFTALNRRPGGMVIPDAARFGGAGALVQADLYTGQFQTLGAIATIAQPSANFATLQVPAGTWPAFTYAPSIASLNGTMPSQGILSILVVPLGGAFIPASEIVLVNRAGQSLLVYLPEISGATSAGVRVFVADDGSTWFAPVDALKLETTLSQQVFNGLTVARQAVGQSLPIPGAWPLQQRLPVAVNLCRSERASLVGPGELGIDPELGRFALTANDPAIAQGALTVDFAEAFSAAIGANSERQLASNSLATRLVSRSGDADSALTAVLGGAPIHTTLTDAIAAANNGDVIEIVDSATYGASAGVPLNKGAVKDLIIRAAAGQRPCLTFYSAANMPASSSLLVTVPMDSLSLDGLLVSGGPVFVESRVQQLNVNSCTLDPLTAAFASVVAVDTGGGSGASWLVSASITGGLRTGPGVAQLTVSDAIVDQKNGTAIGGLAGLTSPPAVLKLASDTAATSVQLERVTVLGSVFCEILRASECLFDSIAIVQDQQSGCVRFTRFEKGSVLPRRYQSIPNDAQLSACGRQVRCLAPAFNSRLFGRPAYAQLGYSCPGAILRASESGAEVGAFASTLNTIRLGNLRTKLQEFMPVGLSAVIVAET